MGFLESVKQTFNIAGTEVCVQTKDDVYSQCDVVAGEVLIQGGEYDQEVQSIRLELKEFWTEVRSTGKTTTTVTVYKTHETVDLAGAGTIERQSEHSHEFEVRLPLNARVSTKSTGWLLKVRLDVPKAIDPSGSWDRPSPPRSRRVPADRRSASRRRGSRRRGASGRSRPGA